VSVVGTVVELRGAVVSSAWGSTELIPALRGNRPSRAPQAEVWFGGHPANPSAVRIDGDLHPIDRVDGLEAPPVLLKLLAAAAPLSIQAHPDRVQAEAGFAREDAAGIPIEERTYRDRSAKPEMLRALTPMRLLCGLRGAGESWRLLSELVPSGLDDVLAVLAKGDAALPQAVGLVLRAPEQVTRSRLASLLAGLDAHVGHEEDVALARELLARFPGDPGVLVALLMRRVALAPGEAIFVPPGVLHAYLEGLGVELMAPSDNVVRGGLTVKKVDVDELLDAGGEVRDLTGLVPDIGGAVIGDAGLAWKCF
jgi:mannose-6-phosphate isomerase